MCIATLDTSVAARHIKALMLRPLAPLRPLVGVLCCGVGALACTDLEPAGELVAGGQSGDGSGIHGGQTGDGAGILAKEGSLQCPHKSTVWKGSLNEEVEALELAPAEVLEVAETSVEESFGWAVNQGLKLGGEQTTVTVDLHYEGGEVRVREPDDAQSAQNEVADRAAPVNYASRAAEYCGTLLEIEVQATLTTADGALDETFPVLVTANHKGAAHFEGWLPKKLGGALRERVVDTNSRLYVASMVTSLGSSGEIVAIPLDANDAEVPAPRIGGWPVLDPAVCADPDYGNLVTNLAPSQVDSSAAPQADTKTLSGLYEALVPAGELPLLWDKTPAWPTACSMETLKDEACNTKLHVTPGPAPETFCVSVNPFDSLFFAQATVALEVNTDDLQWQGRYQAKANLSGAEKGAANVLLSVEQQGDVASGLELGFANLKLLPGSDVSLRADFNRGTNGTWGSVSVFGRVPTADADAPATYDVLVGGYIGENASSLTED